MKRAPSVFGPVVRSANSDMATSSKPTEPNSPSTSSNNSCVSAHDRLRPMSLPLKLAIKAGRPQRARTICWSQKDVNIFFTGGGCTTPLTGRLCHAKIRTTFLVRQAVFDHPIPRTEVPQQRESFVTTTARAGRVY